jgi:sugar phosphate isomerase/epimerase
MHRLRIAVATAGFRQPLRRAIQTAAECGASGVQFDVRQELPPADFGETARRQLLHELDELGLRVASLTLPLRRPIHDQSHLDARVAALRQAMEFAWQLKSRVLTVRAGRVPDNAGATTADTPNAEEYQRYREVLADLARHGNDVGVTLCITPAGDDPATLRQLIGSISEGPLGIDFDPAGCVAARQDPTRTLRELHETVAHVQVRDALQDLDGSQEVPVGRGEVQWDEVLALLDEMNYAGWLTVRRTAGDDRIGDAARAVQYVRNVAAG